MRQKLNLAGVALIGAVILRRSTITYSGGAGGGGAHLTVLLHFLAYFGLAAALLVFFHDTQRGILESVLVASLFGLAVEIIQLQVPTRFFSLKDIATNVAGASLVLLDHRIDAVTEVVRLEDRVIETFLEL